MINLLCFKGSKFLLNRMIDIRDKIVPKYPIVSPPKINGLYQPRVQKPTIVTVIKKNKIILVKII